jgi:hypothetical protein
MNNFSFAFWVYTIDNNYYTCATITNSGFYNNGQVAMNLDINGSTSIIPHISMPSQWTIRPTLSTNTVQTWTHLAYTFDLNNFCVTFYVNGTVVNQSIGTSAFSNASASQFVLGKSFENVRAFNGYIRQFLFYRKLLTASQITDIYNSTM